MIKNIIIITALASLSQLSFAKGLNELTPEKTKETEAEKMEEMKDEAQTIGTVQASNTATQKEEKNAFSDKLNIATSFGWIGAHKKSENWRAAGMGDISLTYKLPLKVSKLETYTSFRYAPMDVAPTIKSDDLKHDYIGVIEGYHLGGGVDFNLSKDLSLLAQGELGLLVVHLKEFARDSQQKTPDDNGFVFNVGGGLDWSVLDNLKIGPRLYIGMGSFTTYQLSANTSFAF